MFEHNKTDKLAYVPDNWKFMRLYIHLASSVSSINKSVGAYAILLVVMLKFIMATKIR